MRTLSSHVFHVFLFFMLFIIAATGCSSGSSSPLTPELSEVSLSGDGPPDIDVTIDKTAVSMTLEIFEVTMTPGSDEITVRSLRSALSNLNTMDFLQGREGDRSILEAKITDAGSFLSNGVVKLDISITHPLDSPAMTLFDVIGVVIGDGSKISGYDPRLCYAGVNDLLLLNADGYTPSLNSSVTSGSNDDFTATINGYKYFAEDINPDETLDEYFSSSTGVGNRGAFSSGSTITRSYVLRFPASGMESEVSFQLAIIGHWEQAVDEYDEPIPEPSVDCFPLYANAPEPFCIRCDTSGSAIYYVNEIEKGGELVLDLTIWDWQAPLTSGDVTQQISRIVVESPSGMIPGGAVVYSGDEIGNAMRPCCVSEYSTRLVFTVSDVIPTGEFEQLLIAVESNPVGDDTQPTSYMRTLVQVHDEYIAPAKDYVNLIVILSDTPGNLHTSVREQADGQFSRIGELSDQIKAIYRNNRGLETSPSVRSLVTPIIEQILILKEDRSSYINSLLHEALDGMQEELAQRIEYIPDTEVKLKDLILNSLVVETTREHIGEIENLPGVLEVIEDIAVAIPIMGTSARALKLRSGSYPNVVWNEGYHGEGIDVLGIDSGVYTGHSAFNGVDIESAFFPVDEPDCTTDDDWTGFPYGHGTMSAGVVTSRDSTNKGMAYEIETYYNGKHCDVAAAFSSTVMAAYDWAALGGDGFNDAEVINLSMIWGFNCSQQNGLDYRSSYLDVAIDMYDVVWSIGGGNLGQGCSGSIIYDKPQTCYNGVTVCGVRHNETGTRTDDSYYTGGKRGPVYGPYSSEERLKPELVCYARAGIPGSDGNWYWFTGTSVSAPHYAGLAAVLMSAGITDAKEIRALTFATAEDWGSGTGPSSNGPDYYTGFGIPDAWAAYSHIADTYSGTLDFSGDYDLYRIENVQEGDRVVLVYNRHDDQYNWKISNLDLKAYDENTGELLHETTKIYDNKEYIQFESSDTGRNVIIRAVATSLFTGLSYEPYSISANTEMVEQAYSIAINMPAEVHQYDVIEISADVENITELLIEDVTLDLNMPPEWELIKGDDPQNIGNLDPAQIGTAAFHVLVTTNGEESVSVDVSGSASGDPPEGTLGASLNVQQSLLLTCPAEIDQFELFDIDADYTNHSPVTYGDLSFAINFDPDKITFVTGENPAPKGDILSGEYAHHGWEFLAVEPGDTSLSLDVLFTYDGEDVSFTTSDTVISIVELPYAPTLISPFDGIEYQLSDYLTFSWEKAPGPDPDGYWLDVWVDGEHWTVFPDGGIFLGGATLLNLPPIFVELHAGDGVWEWAIAAEISGYKYWSDKWTITKHVAPDLIGPIDGAVVEVNELFNWNTVPGAINYIARLTGILPGDQPFYLPLNSDAFYFQLTQPYYDILNPGITYTWAIAGTTLGSVLNAGDQAKLAKLSYSEIRSFTVE